MSRDPNIELMAANAQCEPDPADLRDPEATGWNEPPDIDQPAPAATAEAEAQPDTGKPPTSIIVRGVNGFSTDIPPESIVLGGGWLRRGDIGTFISTAGSGKSVAVTQACIAWGLGLPYMGIAPPRPLRILYFSGEDDEGTLGAIREGFLEHSEALTGRRVTREMLDPLVERMRTEFSRAQVGNFFHAHLGKLLSEEPADLVVINPLLSYLGDEVVKVASAWLRSGLMPILQEHGCGSLIAHHTPKMSKTGWDETDDIYSAIGGGEMANIPRAILTMRPTEADGLWVLKSGKRPAAWRDDDDRFTSSWFMRRTDNPNRPAWLPVGSDEAADMIDGAKVGKGKGRKVGADDITDILSTGAMQKVGLIAALRKATHCGETAAKDAIRDALKDPSDPIAAFKKPRKGGGKDELWLCLAEHLDQWSE